MVSPSRLYPPRARPLLFRIRLVLALFVALLSGSALICFAAPEVWRGVSALGSSGVVARVLDSVPQATRLEARRGLEESRVGTPAIAGERFWVGYGLLVLAGIYAQALGHPRRHRGLLRVGVTACLLLGPAAMLFQGVLIESTEGFSGGVPAGSAAVSAAVGLTPQLALFGFGLIGACPLLLAQHYLRLLERVKARPRRVRLHRETLRGLRSVAGSGMLPSSFGPSHGSRR